jgi:hypothetical protein
VQAPEPADSEDDDDLSDSSSARSLDEATGGPELDSELLACLEEELDIDRDCLSLTEAGQRLIQCATMVESSDTARTLEILHNELSDVRIDLRKDKLDMRDISSLTTADVDANIIGISHRGCRWGSCAHFSDHVLELVLSSMAGGWTGGNRLKGAVFTNPYHLDPRGPTVSLTKVPRAHIGELKLGSFSYDVVIYGSESKLGEWKLLGLWVRSAILKAAEVLSCQTRTEVSMQECSGVLNSMHRCFNSTIFDSTTPSDGHTVSSSKTKHFIFSNRVVVERLLNIIQENVTSCCPDAHLVLCSLGCKAQGNSSPLQGDVSECFNTILTRSLDVSTIRRLSTFWICDFGLERACWTTDNNPTVTLFSTESCAKLNKFWKSRGAMYFAFGLGQVRTFNIRKFRFSRASELERAFQPLLEHSQLNTTSALIGQTAYTRTRTYNGRQDSHQLTLGSSELSGWMALFSQNLVLKDHFEPVLQTVLSTCRHSLKTLLDTDIRNLTLTRTEARSEITTVTHRRFDDDGLAKPHNGADDADWSVWQKCISHAYHKANLYPFDSTMVIPSKSLASYIQSFVKLLEAIRDSMVGRMLEGDKSTVNLGMLAWTEQVLHMSLLDGHPRGIPAIAIKSLRSFGWPNPCAVPPIIQERCDRQRVLTCLTYTFNLDVSRKKKMALSQRHLRELLLDSQAMTEALDFDTMAIQPQNRFTDTGKSLMSSECVVNRYSKDVKNMLSKWLKKDVSHIELSRAAESQWIKCGATIVTAKTVDPAVEIIVAALLPPFDGHKPCIDLSHLSKNFVQVSTTRSTATSATSVILGAPVCKTTKVLPFQWLFYLQLQRFPGKYDMLCQQFCKAAKAFGKDSSGLLTLIHPSSCKSLLTRFVKAGNTKVLQAHDWPTYRALSCNNHRMSNCTSANPSSFVAFLPPLEDIAAAPQRLSGPRYDCSRTFELPTWDTAVHDIVDEALNRSRDTSKRYSVNLMESIVLVLSLHELLILMHFKSTGNMQAMVLQEFSSTLIKDNKKLDIVKRLLAWTQCGLLGLNTSKAYHDRLKFLVESGKCDRILEIINCNERFCIWQEWLNNTDLVRSYRQGLVQQFPWWVDYVFAELKEKTQENKRLMKLQQRNIPWHGIEHGQRGDLDYITLAKASNTEYFSFDSEANLVLPKEKHFFLHNPLLKPTAHYRHIFVDETIQAHIAWPMIHQWLIQNIKSIFLSFELTSISQATHILGVPGRHTPASIVAQVLDLPFVTLKSVYHGMAGNNFLSEDVASESIMQQSSWLEDDTHSRPETNVVSFTFFFVPQTTPYKTKIAHMEAWKELLTTARPRSILQFRIADDEHHHSSSEHVQTSFVELLCQQLSRGNPTTTHITDFHCIVRNTSLHFSKPVQLESTTLTLHDEFIWRAFENAAVQADQDLISFQACLSSQINIDAVELYRLQPSFEPTTFCQQLDECHQQRNPELLMSHSSDAIRTEEMDDDECGDGVQLMATHSEAGEEPCVDLQHEWDVMSEVDINSGEMENLFEPSFVLVPQREGVQNLFSLLCVDNTLIQGSTARCKVSLLAGISTSTHAVYGRSRSIFVEFVDDPDDLVVDSYHSHFLYQKKHQAFVRCVVVGRTKGFIFVQVDAESFKLPENELNSRMVQVDNHHQSSSTPSLLLISSHDKRG